MLQHRSQFSAAGTSARADSCHRGVEDFVQCIGAVANRLLDLVARDIIALADDFRAFASRFQGPALRLMGLVGTKRSSFSKTSRRKFS